MTDIVREAEEALRRLNCHRYDIAEAADNARISYAKEDAIYVYNAIERLLDVVKEREWRPDIESAPKDGTEILGINTYKFNDMIFTEYSIIAWNGNDKYEKSNDWYCMADGQKVLEYYSETGSDYKIFKPTHWQPLPLPPKPEGGE